MVTCLEFEKVLIVDDNSRNIWLLKMILEEGGYRICSTTNSLEVLTEAVKEKPDLILLDIMMPEIDGFQLCKMLKDNSETYGIPVIMVTAKTEGQDIRRAFEAGAFDYIRKPIDDIEMLARVKSALNFKKQQDVLEEMAVKDSLTGLYNHALLLELLQRELIKQDRNKTPVTFAMVDIDYFKSINDSYGHQVGDKVIRGVADIIKRSIRASDIAGRYGGEEFGVIITEANPDQALRLCDRIRREIEHIAFDEDDKIIKVTASVGFYCKLPEDKKSPTEVIILADKALYKAKKGGRNRTEYS
jgi:diguanylate cyclase (GGDEF)-like protein